MIKQWARWPKCESSERRGRTRQTSMMHPSPQEQQLREEFSRQLQELMSARGWTETVHGSSSRLLGDFVRPVRTGVSVRVTVALRRGSPHGFIGWPGTAGFRRLTEPLLGLAGNVGVRNEPSAALVALLGIPMGTEIVKPLAELAGEPADEVMLISDAASTGAVVKRMVWLVDTYVWPFATRYADVDAMLALLAAGGQPDNDEGWRYQFAAALLAANTRTAEARTVLAEGRIRAASKREEFSDYEEFATRLEAWLNQGSPW